MGMNYYCSVGKKTVVCEYGCEHIVPNVLHIGKDSYGWAFLLQGYDDEERSIKSLNDWKKILKNAERIYNEDGENLTYDEMMKIINKSSVKRTADEIKEISRTIEDMERSERVFGTKYVIKNGLINEKSNLELSGAKSDENFMIEFREFS